jgi:hypothetical protein
MPSAQTLHNFIAMVESGAHAQAIEAFYTEQASMRENLQPPRVGRAKLAERERQVLSRGNCTMSQCIHPVLVQDDTVVIRWFFRFEWHDGTVTEIEELAYQRWEGERIAQEQFFYDPAQMQPKRA